MAEKTGEGATKGNRMARRVESPLVGETDQKTESEKIGSGRSISRTAETLLRRRGPLLAVYDFVVIFVAFFAAYFIRFHWGPMLSFLPPSEADPALEPYLKMAGLTGFLWVFLLSRDQEYKRGLQFSRPLTYHAKSLITTGFYSMVFMIVVSFSFRYFLLSRLVYAIGFALAFTLLLLARIGLSQIKQRLDARDYVLNRIVILGGSPTGDKLLKRLLDMNPCTRVIGRLGPVRDAEDRNGWANGYPFLGPADRIAQAHAQSSFDQLIVAGPGGTVACDDSAWRETLVRSLNFCEARDIPVYMVPDLLDISVRRQDVGTLAGIPLIVLKDASLHPFYAGLKRAMDICLSLAVIILGLPVWVFIAALVKLTGRGPVFFVQKRAGLHGRPFNMYKFRSMVQDADQRLRELVDFDKLSEPVFKLQRDPRVTAVGRFLRRTSLDEIPQFINVLLGAMSVVGPRPEQVELVQRYNPYQMRRLKAKPGITGYQQVMSRGDPSLSRRIEYDLYYLKRQSFFLDWFIIFKTVLVVIRGDGAR